MLLDNYKKQSPIVGVAGLGGGINSYIFLSSGSDYVISRSLRFNSGDSAYLSRTPSSAGNRRTWTWAAWVKRNNISTRTAFFNVGTAQNDSSYFAIELESAGDMRVAGWNTLYAKTDALFRDPSAWYHFVIAVDTTQAAAANQVKIYQNGNLLTKATENAITQNADLPINSASQHNIGYLSQSNQYGDKMFADIHFVDGQALTPTSFGETDSDGVWQPKKFSGSHGTNGFHLDFKDNSSDAALGYDAAGSNNYTVNNLTAAAPGLATANQGFDVVTYTGNAGTKTVTGLAFQPDLLWLKRVDGDAHHYLVDSVRGLGTSERLASDRTDAAGDGTQRVSSLNSNGFTVSGNYGYTNINGGNYVAWAWKAGGAASSNTDGTITSSVSANTTYGFSVVTWTGAGTGSAKTVGHSLGAVPKFIITKSRSLSDNWGCYHVSLGNTKDIFLNSTNAARSYPTWNNTDPTSSVFSVGQTGQVNEQNATYVGYCWSEISGFSKFASYTGTGTGGNKVTTGFKPKFVIIKATSSSSGWGLYQEPVTSQQLMANCSGEEGVKGDCQVGSAKRDIQANVTFNDDGFTLSSGWAEQNASGTTYIYAAFAAKPDQSAIDALIDSPSQSVADETDTGAGGEITGNYATLSPLIKGSNVTLSEGNLKAVSGGSGNVNRAAYSTIAVPATGAFYCEVTINATNGMVGSIRSDSIKLDNIPGCVPNSAAYYENGSKYLGDCNGASYGASYTTGDTIGIAINNGSLTFYKNGVSQGVATSGLTGSYLFGFGSYNNNLTFNFGQRSFAYPLSNHKSINTANLPTPTIADGSKYFDTKLWTGDGASTRTISNYGFSPDFIWIKNRTTAGWQHVLYDQIRGAGTGSVTKSLSTDSTRTEASGNDTNHGYLSGFTSDGFNLVKGSQGGGDYVNHNSWDYVGWAWDAGTSTVTNNNGTITSQVRANQTAGFSICTYDGSGSNGTWGHGLLTAPDLVIVKCRNVAQNWAVQHSALGPTNYAYLQTTNAFRTSSGTAFWNDTAPTNTTVSVGTDNDTNSSGKTYVAYNFSTIPGYSSFGKYIGNGDADGIFIYTGFTPSWLLFKRSDSTSDWSIYDTTRDPHNVAGNKLEPNTTDAESSSATVDILSNGFKFRRNSLENGGNDVYVYAAFASKPFNSARAR